MFFIPQEDQAILDAHIREASRILRKYTDPEKLKNFETIEVEARKLVIEQVAPGASHSRNAIISHQEMRI